MHTNISHYRLDKMGKNVKKKKGKYGLVRRPTGYELRVIGQKTLSLLERDHVPTI